MTTQPEPRTQALERLSALADGEGGEACLPWASSAWRTDASLRERWHAYHLIGDAIRSDELAGHPDRDESFLRAFRQRLADEPVVMAPQPEVREAAPEVAPRRSRRPWTASAAVAAGFVAVAGVLLVTQEGADPQIAAADLAPVLRPMAVAAPVQPVISPAATLATVSTDPVATETEPVQVPTVRILRDPQLQAYLEAHRQSSGSTALGVPSGFLRAETTATGSKR